MRTVTIRIDVCLCRYWPLNAADRLRCPNCGMGRTTPEFAVLLDRDGNIELDPQAWEQRSQKALMTATYEARA